MANQNRITARTLHLMKLRIQKLEQTVKQLQEQRDREDRIVADQRAGLLTTHPLSAPGDTGE